jgi:hypothetical protein
VGWNLLATDSHPSTVEEAYDLPISRETPLPGDPSAMVEGDWFMLVDLRDVVLPLSWEVDARRLIDSSMYRPVVLFATETQDETASQDPPTPY